MLIRQEAVTAICAMLLLPGGSPAVGFTGLTCQRTGKARFPFTLTKRWQSQPPEANRQLSREETARIYFNDSPLLSEIGYDENANEYVATYDLMDNETDVLQADDVSGFLHFNKAYTTNLSGWNPHTPTMPASVGVKGQRQFWFDTTADNPGTITLTTVGTPGADDLQGGFQLYRNNSGDTDFEGLPGADPGYVPFVSGQQVYTIQPTISDDYSIQVINAGEDLLAAGFQVRFSFDVGSWGHLPCDGFLDDAYRYARGKVRMLAHDVLVKNGASELNDQGWITVARLQDETDWYDIVSQGGDNSLFKIVSNYGDDTVRYVDTFKRGLHVALLPGVESWAKMNQPMKLSPSQAITYDMAYMRMGFTWNPVIVVISSINPENGTAITGCDALFISNQWFEFTTSNKHEDCTVPWVSALEWYQALWMVNHYGVAREVSGEELDFRAGLQSIGANTIAIGQNASHIGNIMGWLARRIGTIKPLINVGVKRGRDYIAEVAGDEVADAAAQVANATVNQIVEYGKKKGRRG